MARSQSRQLSRPVQFVLRGIIVLFLTLTGVWTALNFYPGLAILPVALAGVRTSPFCTTWQSVQDASVKVTQAGLRDEIARQTRLVRSDGAYKLWATPKGEFWVPASSDDILPILLAQQQRNIYGKAENGGVRAGDIVLDGGAHVGVYVRTALDAGAVKVIAIEPSPEPLECLRRNFAAEIAAGTVIIIPKGIWDEEKRLVFYKNRNGGAGDSFLEKAAGAEVIADIPVTTIDRVVSDLRLSRVDMIKADIKGAGTRMIAGASNTIRSFHPRMVISVEEPPEDPAAIRHAVLGVAPDYQFRCGPCLFTGDEIRNDTMFFQ